MRSRKGFTLLELLIISIILGILLVVAIPQYMQSVDKARASRVKGNLEEIREVSMAIHSATGDWPGDLTSGGGSGEVAIDADLDGDDEADVSLSFTDDNYDYSISGSTVTAAASGTGPTFTMDLTTGEITED
ncbi:MAG: prepilin-type N-terminal cleavage/methylation domain-containing protein [Candidatus Omnitrophica bacterium]|nr:prepilin-type N-terminal cleavage/methylation domain-containing protein [Candidatus Omnitrophota bacterium]